MSTEDWTISTSYKISDICSHISGFLRSIKTLCANYSFPLKKQSKLFSIGSKYIYDILIWLCRAWFTLIPVLFAILHYFLWDWISLQNNQSIALVLEVMGGLLILESINSRSRVLDNKSLESLYIDWIHNRPRLKNHLNIQAKAQSATAGVDIDNSVILNTLEDKIEYLFQEISWLKTRASKLEHKSKEIDESLSEAQGSFRKLIKRLILDDLGRQIFGVMLLVYGSVLSFLI